MNPIDQRLESYLRLLLKFKSTYEDDEKCDYLVRPSLNHAALGCVGIIIHPSLPNEEIVCIGLNEHFWTFEKRVAVFNSAILKADHRKLEASGMKKQYMDFINNNI